MADNIVTENEIKLVLHEGKKSTEALKFYNPRLSLFREAVQGTLQIEVESTDTTLLCLDAVTGSGLVGLQWKKQFGESVHIIAADRNLDDVRSSCVANGIEHSDWLLDSSRVIGELPRKQQKSDEIHTCPFAANVVLHHEAFNFVYVQPNGCISNYIDSVFTNIRTNGVACFVTPNIASQCFRSPKQILRQYQAHVMKTEYVKEMAARVVIADIARSAAKHCRGVDILYTLCAEDHFLIVVKVTKSTEVALDCVQRRRMVLHCLMCEERVVSPETHSPIESPYSLLPCDCKDKTPGKTAVLLGPMWVGNIFNFSYLGKLVSYTKQTFPNSKINSLLEALLTEAKCQGIEYCKLTSNQNTVKQHSTNENNRNDEGEPAQKKQKMEHGNNGACQNSKGRLCGKVPQNGDTVNMCRSSNESNTVNESNLEYKDTPLFYYDLHKQKYAGLPKSDKLVTILREEGYRASRTHFEHSAIRTNATAKQIHNTINKCIKRHS